MEENNFIPTKYVEHALNLSGLWKVLILVIVVVIPSIAFMWVTDRLFIFNLVKAYINDIAATFNLNTYLASAITLIVFLIAMYFIGKAGLSKSSRTIAVGGIVALLLAYYFLMAYGTDPHIFDAKGNPIKCYVITREGDVRFLEPIKMDPVTGRARAPASAMGLECFLTVRLFSTPVPDADAGSSGAPERISTGKASAASRR